MVDSGLGVACLRLDAEMVESSREPICGAKVWVVEPSHGDEKG